MVITVLCHTKRKQSVNKREEIIVNAALLKHEKSFVNVSQAGILSPIDTRCLTSILISKFEGLKIFFYEHKLIRT